MISVLILAGGKSSRMGYDKALIKINDQPLLTRTYHIANQFTNLIYVKTSRIEKYLKILPSECNFIPESNTFAGPLIAFYQSLTYFKTEWVLLLACDLPLLDVAEINHWLTQFPNINKNTIAFLPKNSKGWEALCGFYRIPLCLPSLEKFIAQGGKSFQHWLKTQTVEEILVSNPDTLFNCNTPQQLKGFR